MSKTRVDNKVDIKQAIQLKTLGATYQEIAATQGVSKQAIHKAIKNLLPTQDTEIFKEKRADILSNMQLRLLQSIDHADIKKAPMGSRVLAACQLYDKERTERGLTNSISAVIHSDIEALRATSKGPDYEVIDIDGE